MTDAGCGDLHGSDCARNRADRSEERRIAGQRVVHHAAVAHADGVDPGRVDTHVAADVGNGRGDEADVVDAFLGGPAAAAAAVDVPGPVQANRIADDELGRVR
jgi:hypothetical protein